MRVMTRKDWQGKFSFNPGAFIGLGIPWCCLGIDSLFSDSGFILIYEPLRWMYKQFGVKSLFLLDDRFKDIFESRNNPEESGVYPVYSGKYRMINHQKGGGIPDDFADNYLSGLISQVAFIFTNKRWFVPMYSFLATHHFYHYTIPVYCQPTCAGLEGLDDFMSNEEQIWRFRTLLTNETAGMVLARRMLFVSADQVRRAKKMLTRYLSPTTMKDVMERSVNIGGGLSPELRPYSIPDDEVRKRLQTKQKKFRVSYIGRFNSNKRISQIYDTMQPLFITHDIKFEVVTTGALRMPATYKRCSGETDARDMLSKHETGGRKGRDYYFGKILPSIQCSIMASLFESHPSVPREVAYVGVPVVLPRCRGWATATMGPDYPFYYDNETDCMAMIKRIRDGRVSDKDVDAFLKTRNNMDIIQMMDYNATKMYRIFRQDFVLDVMPRIVDRQLTKLETAFLEAYPNVGERFIWNDFLKLVGRKVLVFGTRTKDTSRIDAFFYLSPHFKVINPATGLFERIAKYKPKKDEIYDMKDRFQIFEEYK